MIKCNVTACGTISSSAEEKQSKDGEKFISFGMIVPLLGKDGTAKEVWVTVSAPGNKDTVAPYSAIGEKFTKLTHVNSLFSPSLSEENAAND